MTQTLTIADGFRLNHDLGGSRKIEGSPRKVLEVPKSPWIKGASIPWPRLHLQHYILMGNPIFGGPQALSRKSSLLAAAKEGEELIYTSTISKEEEGARGLSPQGPPPSSGEPRRRLHAGAASPPRRGKVASIFITTGLHLLSFTNTSSSIFMMRGE